MRVNGKAELYENNKARRMFLFSYVRKTSEKGSKMPTLPKTERDFAAFSSANINNLTIEGGTHNESKEIYRLSAKH